MSSIPYRRQQETAAETAAHGHAAEAADDMPPLTPAEEKELLRRIKAVKEGTVKMYTQEEAERDIQAFLASLRS